MADRPGSFRYWLINQVQRNRAGTESEFAQTRLQDLVRESEQRYFLATIEEK